MLNLLLSPLIASVWLYMWLLRLISHCPRCQTVVTAAAATLSPLSVATCLCLCGSKDHYSSSIEPNGAYQHQYHYVERTFM